VDHLWQHIESKLKVILAKAWPVAEILLNAGEKIVEISDHTG